MQTLSISPSPRPLIVDHFAGGGGASTGIQAALGCAPHIAVNHSDVAISVHRANHPGTTHYCESVWEVDPLAATQGRPVALMWQSPACTHFSVAKGSVPLDRRIRGLAWLGVRWAAEVRPSVIVTENVTAFRGWGPLGGDGRPDTRRRGETFAAWVAAYERLGYTVEHRVLDAADYGAPTHRERLFVIARRDGEPITWPVPTHGPGCARPWVTVAEVIDWGNLGEPVAGRTRGLKPTTSRKITDALAELGETAPNGNRAALVQYNGGTLGRVITRPLGTLTCVERYGLAQQAPDGTVYYRMLTVAEMTAAQGFPQDYRLPAVKREAVQMLGNSVSPLVAAAVVRVNKPVEFQRANAAD